MYDFCSILADSTAALGGLSGLLVALTAILSPLLLLLVSALTERDSWTIPVDDIADVSEWLIEVDALDPPESPALWPSVDAPDAPAFAVAASLLLVPDPLNAPMMEHYPAAPIAA